MRLYSAFITNSKDIRYCHRAAKRFSINGFPGNSMFQKELAVPKFYQPDLIILGADLQVHLTICF